MLSLRLPNAMQARADPSEFDDMVRINFAPLTGGAAQSITLSRLHLVSKMAGPQGKEQQPSATERKLYAMAAIW